MGGASTHRFSEGRSHETQNRILEGLTSISVEAVRLLALKSESMNVRIVFGLVLVAVHLGSVSASFKKQIN